MEAGISFDDDQKRGISEHSNEIQDKEWSPNPTLHRLRPGIPISVNTEGMKTMMLETGSVLGSPDANKKRFSLSATPSATSYFHPKSSYWVYMILVELRTHHPPHSYIEGKRKIHKDTSFYFFRKGIHKTKKYDVQLCYIEPAKFLSKGINCCLVCYFISELWTKKVYLFILLGNYVLIRGWWFSPYFTFQLLLLLLLLLSHFSHVQLCATRYAEAHQAPLSQGFFRQEHWRALPFPSPMHESEKWKWSRSVVSDSQPPHELQPTRLLHPWYFPGKSTGVGCH